MATTARLLADIIQLDGDIKTQAIAANRQVTTTYTTVNDLPISGLTAGDQAFVSSNNRLYISNGTGWYNVAVINATPNLTISPSGAVTLATDGSTPTVITLTGTDSDNADASLIYSVESDGSFSNIATLSQDSSVFTITPLAEGSATPGSSTLTFKVSDGISFGSGTTEFSLTFGPDWSSYTVLKEVDGANAADFFGGNSHISPDGNWAFGMLGGSSATSHLKIYSRSGSTWTETQQIGTSQWVDEALYGQNCSITCSEDGEWLVVGNIGEDDYGTNAGVAYLYRRTSGTYAYVKDLSYVAANSFFGRDTAMSRDGTFVAVSGERFDGAYSDQGGLRVYTTTDNWSTHSGVTVIASNAGATDYFGYCVELSGDTNYMAVGARLEDDPIGSSNSGAVYVYTRSGTTWTEQAIVRNPDNTGSTSGTLFGHSLAINYDGTVMVCQDVNGHHIFTRSGSTWSRQQTVGPTSNVNVGVGGNAINDAGNLLVTSDYENELTQIYKEEGGTWSLVNTLTSTLDPSRRWGYSVFADKDLNYILVGSQNDGGTPASNGRLSFFEAG